MRFQPIFVAVTISTALIVTALLTNSKRPAGETSQPTASHVTAQGKCAACHRNVASAVVHEFEMSAHAAQGVSCLDCHQPAEGQESLDHNGFTISTDLTSKNCAACHRAEYDQFLRSRHAAPAMAAVTGTAGFSEEQIAHAERYHPGMVKRPANGLSILEGQSAIEVGCVKCHQIGAPNSDGSIGSCTECHARHNASVQLARLPETCGQCHMGPDHSQLEIYHESKHGVLFNDQRDRMNLSASPKSLTTADMPVPTCATCHLSGLNGLGVTHDTTERLSWLLYAPVSKKRTGYQAGQDAMKSACLQCHTTAPVERFYEEAEGVVEDTNTKIAAALAMIQEARDEGLLTPEPFDQEIDFLEFDIWHYYGRTAKHGAFMGGADFVQWHGNYELQHYKVKIEEAIAKLRAAHK
ncbi:MAG: hydroxylamine dehydrogenase [Planctomycetota bacterium]|jgi:hydroxylamine dehydrogenase